MVEQFAGGKAKSTLDAYTAAAEALAVPVQAMNATVPSDVERQRSGLRRLTDPYWVARDEPLDT